MIKVRDLKYSYGNIQALMGVDFTLKKGEILAIIGANGAGKTTLMKCISGLLKPQKGEIFLEGKKLPSETHEVVRSGVVLVPEARMIFPGLSVKENLLLGGYTLKNKKIEIEKIYEMLPVMSERRNQRAGTLSGGEQQMLAMGRGLISNPKVLLLDEPSLGLAPYLVNDIMNIIKQINKDGVTILLVEQNAKKALSLAHHACLIETGKVVKTGTGNELLNDPSIIDSYLGGMNK